MKLLILGASGRLGAALSREYRNKFDVTGFNHAQLDLSNLDDVREKLGAASFDVLINAAAFTNVDLCEKELDKAFRINAEAPDVLAKICRDKSAKLIHFSTDYVFNGKKRAPYTEEDEANPTSVYGESKLAGEKNVFAAQDRHLVVRVSWVFGPDRPSFIDAVIKRAQENEEVDAIADKFSTPTYTNDIAAMLPQFFTAGGVDLGSARTDRSDVADSSRGNSASDYSGILHFANAGECSWREYAQWALDCCQGLGVALRTKTVGAIKMADMAGWVARRPVYSVLSSAKYREITGRSPRAWRDAVADYIRRSYSKK
jgi:dTDP-4-dehydrorhamnose reductase